ncbi:type II toxin-antitoxin system VapC family toxin [Actinokineospora iranica]|uniref:PIN domain-containing protein n=1 Tax=Actinokineospora iranica TaxID=1271860 RepID=A0A1G6RG34_9PSEU|nr:type II toxin-antitoxin system VapC family toxin [Actinokineospora iranica]SDD03518.1 hypothetical protein SAMN05216174_106330 [Actinokineospora iranica]
MKKFVIVDTDVFSNLWQGKPVPASFIAAMRDAIPVLCFATVAEAHFGAVNANWGTKRLTQLEAAMRTYAIAPYTPELAALWGRLKAQARKKGHPLGDARHTNDLWICTTAIFHQAPLVTNNVRHFEAMPQLHLVAR